MAKPFTKEQQLFHSPREPKEKKAPKPIRKKSIKRTAEEKIYLTLRKVFLENRMLCEVKGCKHRSEEVHHKAGRTGSLYLDVSTFLAVCSSHHQKIELNPDWAKENEYSVTRTNI